MEMNKDEIEAHIKILTIKKHDLIRELDQTTTELDLSTTELKTLKQTSKKFK